MAIVEHQAEFESNHPLFGILTRPATECRRVGFIFLNSGLLNHVGPYRLYVTTIRRLAESGFCSIRLDMSGYGDSPRRESAVHPDALIADVQDAVSALRNVGVEQVVIGGLCSGADYALRVAEYIPECAGLFLWDGYAPKTAKYYIKKFLPKIVSADAWRRRLGIDRQTQAPPPPKSAGPVDDRTLRDWDDQKTMIDRCADLLDRGVKIFALFTRDATFVYSYCGQLADAVANGQNADQIVELYLPDVRHLLPITEHRELVLNRFTDWAAANFE